MLRQMRFERGGGAAGDFGRRFAIARLACIGRRDGRCGADQRRVGVLEYGDAVTASAPTVSPW